MIKKFIKSNDATYVSNTCLIKTSTNEELVNKLKKSLPLYAMIMEDFVLSNFILEVENTFRSEDDGGSLEPYFMVVDIATEVFEWCLDEETRMSVAKILLEHYLRAENLW